ncbi:MAG: hypothetical protein LBR90_03240 [Elusimicrobiota bacterium]|jgi:Flp pilus assembly protein CpaB|nr:hypothetical protein [Elusimicrobiota bacterium]
MKTIKKLSIPFLFAALLLPCACNQKPPTRAPEAEAAAKPAFAPLGGRIGKHNRIYAFETDAATAAMAQPGSKVDVLTAFDDAVKKNQQTEAATATLMQEVDVIDVIQEGGKRYLLLRISPIEAQHIALVPVKNIKIILRREGDGNIYPLPLASRAALEEKRK